jgi:hypothetical protein
MLVKSYNKYNLQNDETLPNFIERKHPRKGERRKQGARTKVQVSKQPNKGRVSKEEREPLRTEPSTPVA